MGGDGYSREIKATLKPCPFCGSKNVHLLEYYDEEDEPFRSVVQCFDCLSEYDQSEAQSVEDIAEAWNKRPLDMGGSSGMAEVIVGQCAAMQMHVSANPSYMAGWNDALQMIKRCLGWQPDPADYAPSEEDEDENN